VCIAGACTHPDNCAVGTSCNVPMNMCL
jgi:hypothetical protein